ncbi:MAG: MATE family efflux transporter [Lachnospiraceae bacterium]|nr:MATE family efflux transporter [Lachnospiraceae bacterium]
MDLNKIRQNTTGMILQFSIPAIIAMVLTSLITVVDGFFIGNYVGEDGIAAVNLGLPIIYLFLSIGLMVSVGGVAIAGMSLGAGDRTACNQVFCQTIVTTTVFSMLTGMMVALFFEPMLNILGAEAMVRTHFKTYYGILLLELIVMVVNSAFGMFIRGEGNPQYYMKVNIVSVLTNIVLDYVFAVVLHIGIAGIALASLLSELVSFVLIIYFFLRKAKVYQLGRFSYSVSVLKRTLLNGSSEFIGEMSTGIAMFTYNYVIMRRIGVDGVTAFTIVGYVSYVFSMIIVGFGQGASPLISFSYGAKEHKLAKRIRKKTNGFVFAIGAATFLVMMLLAEWYSGLFVKNITIQKMVQSGMMIFMISFFFSGMNAITSFYFTSIGKALESAIISLARGLVVLLACIFVLPAFFGMTGVWLAAPVTEIITICISIWMVRRDTMVYRDTMVSQHTTDII